MTSFAYDLILDKASKGEPVNLIKNGNLAFSIRNIEDEEEFLKANSMLRLMYELNAGIQSGEEHGWFSNDEVLNHFRNNRIEK